MNILFVTAGHFPDGSAQIARIKCFAKVVTHHNGSASVLGVHPSGLGKEHSYSAAKSGTLDGVQFTNSVSPKLFYSNTVSKYLLFAWSIIRSCIWYLGRFRNYDVVYFHQPRFSDSLLILIFTKLFGRKSLVDQTELFSTVSQWARIEQRFVGLCSTKINCISRPIYDYFLYRTELRKLSQLSIIVDMDRFEKVHRTDLTYTIGYIGTFAKKDGLPTILGGFKLAKNDFPELKLHLIGNTRHKNEIQKSINDLGLTDSVNFIGGVSYDTIPKHLSSCDSLIMNRTESNFAKHGYPTKLGEYFATGRPVFMSDSGGYSSDFIDMDTVIKYKPDSKSALAEVIQWRYTHSKESQSIGLRGKQYASNHISVETQGLRFFELLQALMS